MSYREFRNDPVPIISINPYQYRAGAFLEGMNPLVADSVFRIRLDYQCALHIRSSQGSRVQVKVLALLIEIAQADLTGF